MNMHCASRLGWTRSSSEEAADPAQAELAAASGRAAAASAPSSRARRSSALTGGKRCGLLLLAAAALIFVPALAYADVPVATISGPLTVAEPADGATADVVYTVTLTGGVGSDDIVFDYTVTGSATAGATADYTDPGSGKLTISATAATGTRTITVNGDTVREANETLVVTLTKVSTDAGVVTIGSPNVATTTIREGARILEFDSATRSVSVASEGANAVFTVGLAGNTESVAVRYDVVAGTATAADYTAPSGILTLTTATGSITIATKDDKLEEAAESFSVKLSPVGLPADVGLGFATATATIPANDALTASVVEESDAVFEGSTAVFTIELTATATTDGNANASAGSLDVLVAYHTNDSAAMAPDDYEAPSGMLTIPAGQSQGVVSIATETDDLLEGGEKLILTLSKVTTGPRTVSLAAAGDDPGIIVRDVSGTVLVSVDDATVTEGDVAEFAVELSGKVSEDVTVTYALSPDSAEATTDYATGETTITIAAGETTGTITVATVDDASDKRAEDTETFTVDLSGITVDDVSDEVHFRTTEVTGTIIDDDALTATVTGSAQGRQGSPASFIVSLAGGSGSTDVIVTYAVGGTAAEGTDYVAPSGILTIRAADPAVSTGTIEIETGADGDPDETLVLRLTGVSTEKGVVALGAPREATTTLATEDTVIVKVADADATESAGSASFGVTLDFRRATDTLSAPVKLRYTTADGSATRADYTATTGTLTIPATSGESYAGTISVPVEDDNLAENAEAFTLSLSLVNPPDDVLLDRSTAKAEIAVDDADELIAKVSAPASFDEGEDAVVDVELTGATSTAAVVVRYEVTGGAEKNVDYQAPSGSLTLPAGASRGSIVIPTTADDVFEITDDETIVVTLQDTTSTAAGEVEVSTVASENPASFKLAETSQNVMVSVADRTVTEGEQALFPVTLSGKVFDDVTVNYTITDVTTTGSGDGADYTSAATAITIKAGATTGTITVDTAEESVAEDNETFTVRLTLPADSPISVDEATATGTIRDDDPLRVTLEGPGQVPEGVSASDYRVRLIGGTGSAAITVRHTRDGVAQAPVTITAGTTEVALPDISTGADPLVEGHTIVVRITGVSTTSGTVNLGSPREKRTRIVDSDTMTVSISGGGAATEGSDATFTVTRRGTATPTGDVTVRYQVVAGSASSSDYAAPGGTLELGSGPTGTITVPVEPDELAERAETFSVRLTSVRSSAPSDKVVLGEHDGDGDDRCQRRTDGDRDQPRHDRGRGRFGDVRGGSRWHQQRERDVRLHRDGHRCRRGHLGRGSGGGRLRAAERATYHQEGAEDRDDRDTDRGRRPAGAT